MVAYIGARGRAGGVTGPNRHAPESLPPSFGPGPRGIVVLFTLSEKESSQCQLKQRVSLPIPRHFLDTVTP